MSCRHEEHLRKILETNAEVLPIAEESCIAGPQKSKCKEHSTYARNECFTFEEIAEFAS